MKQSMKKHPRNGNVVVNLHRNHTDIVYNEKHEWFRLFLYFKESVSPINNQI